MDYQIGDGNLRLEDDGVAEIEIPNDLLVLESQSPLSFIVDFTYPDLLENMTNYKFYEDRALLAPTLEVVEMVNEFILSQILCEEKNI